MFKKFQNMMFLMRRLYLNAFFKNLKIWGMKSWVLNSQRLWPNNETEVIKRNDINVAVNLKSIFATLDKK